MNHESYCLNKFLMDQNGLMDHFYPINFYKNSNLADLFILPPLSDGGKVLKEYSCFNLIYTKQYYLIGWIRYLRI